MTTNDTALHDDRQGKGYHAMFFYAVAVQPVHDFLPDDVAMPTTAVIYALRAADAYKHRFLYSVV